ncbi:MAG: MurR/RpiR family transcriptional regulator [Thermomicrobiales bacterium]|nr:MurR/RpiR family transcriptional regulator [Thermomicrobiales bacterium]
MDGSHPLVGHHHYDRLSPKQQKLARFVAENPSFAAFATAANLAERAGTSTATVVRFAQALGFDGYEEFQQNVRHNYLRTLRPLEALESKPHVGENLFEVQLYQDLENLRLALHSLHVDLLTEIAERIDAARQIVIVSAGSYSAVALVLGHLLRFMGYPALVEDRGGPHLTAAISPLDDRDLVIGISFWKGAREIVGVLEWASGKGIPTIALADTVYAPLARAATTAVVLPTESPSFYQSMVAPLSIAYGIVAFLANRADADRKQIMREAEQSYDLLDISVNR